jgi:hypothetical protein
MITTSYLEQRVSQVVIQPGHQALALGVTKPHVVLQQLGLWASHATRGAVVVVQHLFNQHVLGKVAQWPKPHG